MILLSTEFDMSARLMMKEIFGLGLKKSNSINIRKD